MLELGGIGSVVRQPQSESDDSHEFHSEGVEICPAAVMGRVDRGRFARVDGALPVRVRAVGVGLGRHSLESRWSAPKVLAVSAVRAVDLAHGDTRRASAPVCSGITLRAHQPAGKVRLVAGSRRIVRSAGRLRHPASPRAGVTGPISGRAVCGGRRLVWRCVTGQCLASDYQQVI